MEIIKFLTEIVKEYFPLLINNGIDIRCILISMIVFEALKRIWFKKMVYKTVKYHKRRMKAMLGLLFIVSLISVVLWNYKYFKSFIMYQMIVSTWAGSFGFYELLKLIGLKKLLNKIIKHEE